MPPQLIAHASLWELEQRFKLHGLDYNAAYDDRALGAEYTEHTLPWLDKAAHALAQCVVSATAFLDLGAVVIDGSFSRALRDSLLQQTRAALKTDDREGLWPASLVEGSIGSDARALGGALLPLHEELRA